MQLLFREPSDVTDVSGPLQFGANGLQRLGDHGGLPAFSFPCAALQADGSYLLYVVNPRLSGVQRFRTWDGFHYEGGESVLSFGTAAPSGDWLGHVGLTYSSQRDEMLCLAWAKDPPAMGVWGYVGKGEESWQPLQDTPLYHDHDSFSLLWHPHREQYVAYQISYQRREKPYADNIGQELRRVLTYRTSTDGRQWAPPGDVAGGLFRPDAEMITPDVEDPAEVEFYRLVVFPYHDRFVGMMLLYAPSPGAANTRYPWTAHGPHLSGEWWLSDDGFSWRRPFRQVFAPGEANNIIQHAPMRIGNRLLWLYPDGIYGLPEGRLFYAGTFANAAFSTPYFTQPVRHLSINAGFNFHGQLSRGMRGQGYLMVEARDEQDAVVAGFEKERCIIHDLESDATRTYQMDHGIARRLHWQGKSLRELAGQRIKLRVYLRDARVYGVGDDTYF